MAHGNLKIIKSYLLILRRSHQNLSFLIFFLFFSNSAQVKLLVLRVKKTNPKNIQIWPFFFPLCIPDQVVHSPCLPQLPSLQHAGVTHVYPLQTCLFGKHSLQHSQKCRDYLYTVLKEKVINNSKIVYISRTLFYSLDDGETGTKFKNREKVLVSGILVMTTVAPCYCNYLAHGCQTAFAMVNRVYSLSRSISLYYEWEENLRFLLLALLYYLLPWTSIWPISASLRTGFK